MSGKFRAGTQKILIPQGPWKTKIKILCVRILVMQIMPGSRSIWSSALSMGVMMNQHIQYRIHI